MADPESERKAAATSREAKLARALRANLRRRKSATAAPPVQNPRNDPCECPLGERGTGRLDTPLLVPHLNAA